MKSDREAGNGRIVTFIGAIWMVRRALRALLLMARLKVCSSISPISLAELADGFEGMAMLGKKHARFLWSSALISDFRFRKFDAFILFVV